MSERELEPAEAEIIYKDKESGSRVRAMFRALKHRNFRLFFSGQLISLIGTWMQMIAESWLVYRLTGSALLLGTVGFVNKIPTFFLASVGGTVADRYSRHRIVIATQASSLVLAFILAALTLTHTVQVWHVMVLATMLGIVNAFDMPARQAFIVEMVGKEDLMNAIALNSSMFNGARIIGPAIAGILVATIGEGWCFFGNGISFIAVIASLLLMKLAPFAAQSRKSSAIQDVVEGFRFVRHTAPIRALLLLLGLVSLVAMPYAVLMPIFADQILHGGARGLGILMGATGVGALIAALILAMRTGVRGLGKWVAIASTGLGVSLILFSFSRSLWLSAALLVPVGFCMMLQMTSSNTLIQAMVPDRLRGRVMAVYTMMFMGMAPIGSLLAGSIAHGIGAPLTVAAGGGLGLIGAGMFARVLPSVRGEARQLILAQGLAGGDPNDTVSMRRLP